MKRRQFLSTAGAAATLPLLPLPVVAAPATPTALNATWAALFARANGRATPALIQKWLGVGPAQAQAVMSELLAKNIVKAPIAGSAASAHPMFPKTGIPGVRKTSKFLTRLGDVIDQLADDAPQEEPTHDTPEPTQPVARTHDEHGSHGSADAQLCQSDHSNA